jgi:hypothetical protein
LEIHTVLWFESLKGRDNLEDLGVDGKKILQEILGKYCEKLWTGFIWIRIVTSCGWAVANTVTNLQVP